MMLRNINRVRLQIDRIKCRRSRDSSHALTHRRQASSVSRGPRYIIVGSKPTLAHEFHARPARRRARRAHHIHLDMPDDMLEDAGHTTNTNASSIFIALHHPLSFWSALHIFHQQNNINNNAASIRTRGIRPRSRIRTSRPRFFFR